MNKSDLKGVKKGSIIDITYKSVMGGTKNNTYIVSARNLVSKKTVDKITLKNINNLKGVKSYIYIRKNGYAGMAVGDLGVSVTKLKILKK